MLIGVALLMCGFGGVALSVSLIRVTSRIKALEYDVEVLAETLAGEEDMDWEETYENYPISEFDARIAQFRDELNTPTYPEDETPSYHPGVYNVPHDTVEDVHIIYTPEYAE